jgi:hypothetical protein
VKRLGIRYPVVQDNNYKTWDNYANQYWPAEYLIDRNGHVRHTHFGEGEYGTTEALIRRLLGANGPGARPIADTTPVEAMTPESYLGYARIGSYTGSHIVPNKTAQYHFAKSLFANGYSYDGTWNVGAEKIVAGPSARMRLDFTAEDVYLVLGGSGTVQVSIDGKHTKTLRVNAERLYTVRASNRVATNALLELKFSPGIQAYSFTFG